MRCSHRLVLSGTEAVDAMAGALQPQRIVLKRRGQYRGPYRRPKKKEMVKVFASRTNLGVTQGIGGVAREESESESESRVAKTKSVGRKESEAVVTIVGRGQGKKDNRKEKQRID